MVKQEDVRVRSRRRFCQMVGVAPFAAAVVLGVGETPLVAESAGGAEDGVGSGSFEVVKGSALMAAAEAMGSGPGSKGLVGPKAGQPFAVVVTAEVQKTAKEFEWHEARDHVFTVLDGTTKMELGGTPKGAHQTKPGEWLAPSSEGATTVMLSKGDLLLVPRGTPHKRTTEGRVVLQAVSVEVPKG